MKIKGIKHIFFDLDKTLWDFESNMKETLEILYSQYLKSHISASLEVFISTYHGINEMLWEQYRKGKLNKKVLRESRFYLTLKKFGIDNIHLSKTMNAEYIELCPGKTSVMPGTYDILEYFFSKYGLYILTNGFIETQRKKLNNCKLDRYFKKVFSSEEIGYNKPDKRIFAFAINSLNAKKEECIMIGDDPVTDIEGANNYGLKQAYVNFHGFALSFRPTIEVSSLIELKNFL